MTVHEVEQSRTAPRQARGDRWAPVHRGIQSTRWSRACRGTRASTLFAVLFTSALSACASRTTPGGASPQKGSVVAAAETGKTLREGLRAQVLLTPERTGHKGVGLALIELDVAHEVPFHRHTGTELLFLLEGDGELIAGAAMTTVNAREGVWIPPGLAHGFRATARTRALALYTPAGPERRYAGGEDLGTTPAGAEVAEVRTPPLVFRPNVVEPRTIGNGTGVVRLALEEERAKGVAASCSLLELSSGASVPEHVHEGSAEVLYVFEGEGTLKLDGREERVVAPAAVLVPEGVRHSFVVTSAAPMRAVQWYTPPGPEQRFKVSK